MNRFFLFFFAVEIINIISIMYAARREFLELLDQWNSYMRLKQFPKNLQQRMRICLKKKFGKYWFNEEEILHGISGRIGAGFYGSKPKIIF